MAKLSRVTLADVARAAKLSTGGTSYARSRPFPPPTVRVILQMAQQRDDQLGCTLEELWLMSVR